MKRIILFSSATLMAASLLAADPKDDVKGAIKKLSDAGNYTWTTTSEFGGNSIGGPSVGKVDKDGIALVTATFNENTIETVIKGTNSATKSQEGTWQTAAERAAAGGGRRGGFGGGGFGGVQALPVVQAEDLLSKVKDLKLADGVYSGELTEAGAKALMSFGGRQGGPAPEITGAKGSAKFWVKDGVLTKYTFNRQGSISRGGGDPFDMDATTTVEVKDVGTTKVTIPEEAKKKVS